MRYFFLAAAFIGGVVVFPVKGSVRVEYIHPENYTDVSFRSMTPQGAEDRLQRELNRTIQAVAAQYLGAYQLNLQILDVAMAGREAFERPGLSADLRIRNGLGKPPKIAVRYEIKDSAGKVVAKGARVLTNLTYQWDYPEAAIDTLYPEKQLLRDWIRGLPRGIGKPVVQAALRK
jgi:hypothetical protein